MSTFPGSNLNVISGIDPVGAQFLGGEVSRLQSDTENRNNNATVQRGQDQRAQESAQQAALQQQQMLQQQKQFETEQANVQTNNEAVRMHAEEMQKREREWRMEDDAFAARTAAGDPTVWEEKKRKTLDREEKLRAYNAKIIGLQQLESFQKDKMAGGISNPYLQRVLGTMNQTMEMEEKVNRSLGDSTLNTIGLLLNAPTNKAQHEAFNKDNIEWFKNVDAEIKFIMKDAGVDQVTAEKIYAQQNKAEVDARGGFEKWMDKIAAWGQRTAAGVLGVDTIAEDTPQEHAKKLNEQVAMAWGSQLPLADEGKRQQVKDTLLVMMDAVAKAASAQGEVDAGPQRKRAALMAQKLEELGVPKNMVKTLASAYSTSIESQSFSKEGVPTAQRDSEAYVERSRRVDHLKRVSDELEKATGGKSVKFKVGTDGKLQYDVKKADAAVGHEFLMAALDGEISASDMSLLDGMDPDVRQQFVTATIPIIKEHVAAYKRIAEDQGLSFDDYVQSIFDDGNGSVSPTGQRLLKLAPFLTQAHSEEASLKGEGTMEFLKGEHEDRGWLASQYEQRLQQERDKDLLKKNKQDIRKGVAVKEKDRG